MSTAFVGPSFSSAAIEALDGAYSSREDIIKELTTTSDAGTLALLRDLCLHRAGVWKGSDLGSDLGKSYGHLAARIGDLIEERPKSKVTNVDLDGADVANQRPPDQAAPQVYVRLSKPLIDRHDPGTWHPE